MINSLSIEDLFWGEIEEGRISFSFKGLPKSIHFTLSWVNDNNINLHLTKNIGDENDKPKIVIAQWSKDLVDKFIPYIPAFIIGKLYVPISFSNYPRSSRKNIRIIYFDDIENSTSFRTLKNDATAILKQHFSVKKKKKLRVKATIEKDILPFFISSPIRTVFLSNLRALKINSFVSKCSRSGIIFIGNKNFHFVTHNNRCYVLRKRKNVQEFLKLFMKPELIDALTVKINEAIAQIQDANTYTDTIPHNKPYQLFLES